MSDTETRPHRSHSQLTSYIGCGHQYYLQRVLHKPTTQSVWLAGGKAFHTTTEQFDYSIWGVDDFTVSPAEVEMWQATFTEEFRRELDEQLAKEPDVAKWRVANRGKETIDWWHGSGRDWIGYYIDWRLSTQTTWGIAEINGAPGIEVEVTTPLGGVPMKGFIDRVLRSKLDSRLVIVDLKSGKKTPTNPMQLATYSVQLEEMVGEPVLWGAYYDARSGQLLQAINLSRFTIGTIGEQYAAFDRGVNAGVFLANLDNPFCGTCEVRKYCKYQGGNPDLT